MPPPNTQTIRLLFSTIHKYTIQSTFFHLQDYGLGMPHQNGGFTTFFWSVRGRSERLPDMWFHGHLMKAAPNVTLCHGNLIEYWWANLQVLPWFVLGFSPVVRGPFGQEGWTCKHGDWSASLDHAGWSLCPEGYYIKAGCFEVRLTAAFRRPPAYMPKAEVGLCKRWFV